MIKHLGERIMAHIGYVRCSTDEDKQNVDRQLQGITLDRKYEEYASGKSEDGRPQFRKMVDSLVEGDHVYFNELSRAGRNTGQLLNTIDTLLKRGVTVHFVTESFVLTENEDANPMQKAMSKLVITVISGCNELLLAQTSVAVKQGLQVAREKGRLDKKSPDSAWRKSFMKNRELGKHKSTHNHQAARDRMQPTVAEIKKIIKYSNGTATLDQISLSLNEAGITTPTGKSFTKATVSRIVKKFNIERKNLNGQAS
jgi:DNA invertase Pin-like site-specific DNA recombinase